MGDIREMKLFNGNFVCVVDKGFPIVSVMFIRKIAKIVISFLFMREKRVNSS